MKVWWSIVVMVFWACPLSLYGAEMFFARYFDIQIHQPAGSPVFGKVNLRRNKDAHNDPIFLF